MAARLNIAEWQSEKSKSYLAYLPWRGEKDLSDMFMNALGFTDKRDCKAETEAFIEVVDAYAGEQPIEQQAETRTKVVEYCLEQDKRGEPVELKSLSKHLNEENKQAFANYVATHKPELEKSLLPEKSQLKNYIRISGRNEMISMSFDSVCLGESVVYDPQNDCLTITNIPSSLKSRLVKHIQK